MDTLFPSLQGLTQAGVRLYVFEVHPGYVPRSFSTMFLLAKTFGSLLLAVRHGNKSLPRRSHRNGPTMDLSVRVNL